MTVQRNNINNAISDLGRADGEYSVYTATLY